MSAENPDDRIKIVDFLLETGAVVNVCDKVGQTPLMFAAKNGLLDIVKLLLKTASLEACDNEGNTVSR